MIRRAPGRAAAWLLVALALGSGCGKEKTVPSAAEGSPTLDATWPNDDRRFWTYRTVRRAWSDAVLQLAKTRELVSRAPTFAELAELLRDHPIGSSVSSETLSFRLAFDGEITTLSGVTAQNLVESFTPWVPGFLADASGGAGGSHLGTAAGGGPIAHVMRARPDLAAPLGRLDPIGPIREWDEPTGLTQGSPPTPLFLHGYAWRKTASWIGTYGDLDTLLAWKFLTESLAPGSEFIHSLVPSVADDVFLLGHMRGPRAVATPVGSFEAVIECLYLLDFGIRTFTDAAGDTLGFGRFFSYGTIAYALGVGPVASYERLAVQAGTLPSRGMGDATLDLVATGSTGEPRARR